MTMLWMSLAWFAFVAAILCAAYAGALHVERRPRWSATFGVVSAVFGALAGIGVWKALQ